MSEVENNVMRHRYKELTGLEKSNIQAIKDAGLCFWHEVEELGNSRELELAKTKIEEAVFWAVKHLTRD